MSGEGRIPLIDEHGQKQLLIKSDKDIQAILEYICSESTKLANCGTYYSRQLYFKTGKIPGKFDWHREIGKNPHFQALHSQVAQQCVTTVAESFKSYIGLVKDIKKGTVTQRPKLPGYRQAGLTLITFPSQAVKLKDCQLRFPLGQKVKAWFGIDGFYLSMPSNLDFKAIREYRILRE